MKKIVLFPILLILITLLSCNVKAQNKENVYQSELENEVWITNKILGLDPSIQKYNLTKLVERRFVGNLTSFIDKINYESRNDAPCGNDYFTTVNGKYKFFDTNKIKIVVDSITYSGEWDKPTEYRKSNDLIYLISKNEDKIILTKQIFSEVIYNTDSTTVKFKGIVTDAKNECWVDGKCSIQVNNKWWIAIKYGRRDPSYIPKERGKATGIKFTKDNESIGKKVTVYAKIRNKNKNKLTLEGSNAYYVKVIK